jgi:hypothetical protein
MLIFMICLFPGWTHGDGIKKQSPPDLPLTLMPVASTIKNENTGVRRWDNYHLVFLLTSDY